MTSRQHHASGLSHEPESASRRFGVAWIALALALAVHVVDEAAHDFLSLYNPTVRAIREQVPWLPLPTFTFVWWISGLALAVTALLALSPFAFRKQRWIIRASYPFAVLMFLNGLVHIGSSIYAGKITAGTWSAPLLIAASIHLLRAVRAL